MRKRGIIQFQHKVYLSNNKIFHFDKHNELGISRTLKDMFVLGIEDEILPNIC